MAPHGGAPRGEGHRLQDRYVHIHICIQISISVACRLSRIRRWRQLFSRLETVWIPLLRVKPTNGDCHVNAMVMGRNALQCHKLRCPPAFLVKVESPD